MKKLILAGLLMLFSVPVLAVDQKLELYDFTGGLLDVISPERMPLKYTPDMGNIELDKDLGLVKRRAYLEYNDTALTGLQQVMTGYSYKKTSGNEYMIVESSNSLFQSLQGGNFSALKSGLTLHTHQTYEVALDVLWGGNGVDNEWSWDGTTFTSYDITNSTNMVKAKLHCWHKNRMFRAGVTGFPLTLYYSQINTTAAGAPLADPADLGTGTNWDYIPEAEDEITALRRSITGDYLYIFTRNSTYALIGDSPSSWRLSRINPFIGCLYDSTMDYLGTNIIFLSSRGIESFDGLSFTLKSSPIDEQIKKLKQINVGSFNFLQDTSEDWGAGTGTNIDTTTYSNKVTMSLASSWTPVDSERNWVDIAMSSDGTKQTAVVDGGKIYLSTDSGATWTAKDISPYDEWPWKAVAMSDDGTKQTAVIYHPSIGQIYISSDSGATWTVKESNRLWTDVAMSADGTKQTAVVTNGQIYISADSGNTWTAKESNRPWSCIAMSSDGTIQLAGAINYGTYVSTDSGATWTKRGNNTSATGADMSPDGTKQIVCASLEQIYISSDSGTTWSTKESIRRWQDVAISADGTKQVATALSGQIYMSIDSGINWATVESNRAWGDIVMSDDGSLLSAIVGGGYIYTKSNSYTASYTTQAMFDTNWGIWGTIIINSEQGTINYYAVTATTTFNLGTNPAFSVTNNGQINSTVGPYIKIISSWTANGSLVPVINSINIIYYGTDYNYPAGKTFNESYYISVTTGTIDNTVYRFNKNGIFEYFNSMYANCFFKYRGELFFGSSQDTGKVYRMNVADTYSDSLGNYQGWYYTPLMNCGDPISNKNFKSLWVTSSRDTQSFSISYQIDNATTTWKTLTPSITPNRINVQKIPFPASTTGKYIQLLINSTSYFNIQGMTLIYETQPLQ